MDPPTTPSSLFNALETFEVRCKDAAFALYTLNYVSLEKSIFRMPALPPMPGMHDHLAKNLFALSAVVPALRDVLETSIFSTGGTGLLSKEQIEILSKNVWKCGPVLGKIEKTVEEVGRLLGPFSHAQDEVVYPDGLGNVRHVLSPCFHSIIVALSAARAEQLHRKGFLTNPEYEEKRRLQSALKHNDYTSIKGLAVANPLPLSDPPFSFNNPPAHVLSVPIKTHTDLVELQHPRGFRGRYGHPDYPLLDKQPYVQLHPELPEVVFDKSFEEAEVERQRLRAEGKYPSVASFGVWPPTFIAPNSIQDYQLRGVVPGMDKNEESQGVIATPSSTRKSTPDVETPSGTETKLDATAGAEMGVTKPGSVTSNGSGPDSNEVTKPARESNEESMEKPATTKLEEQTILPVPTSDQASSSDKETTPTGPLPITLPIRPAFSTRPSHYEAYILRPLCENFYSSIEWTHKIEQLPLDDAGIQSHLRSLGPAHSIIDDISELHPEQLRLIRILANQRAGTLVSAQHGKAADMATKMGMFQVKSVVFVVKTEKEAEGITGGEEFDRDGRLKAGGLWKGGFGGFGGSGPQLTSGLFGGQAPATSAFGGFGSGSSQAASVPFGALPQTSSGFGGFGRAGTQTTSGLFVGQPQTSSGFGAFGSGVAQPTSGLFGGHTQTTVGSGGFGGFGNRGTQTTSGLFGGQPQTSTGFGGFGGFGSRGTQPTSGLFGGQPQTSTGFGGFGGGVPQPTSGVFAVKDQATRAAEHSRRLEEQGEVCTHVEPEKFGSGFDHYQVITPTLKDISFEELRIRDLAAGRTGAFNSNGPAGTAGKQAKLSTDGNPWGGFGWGKQQQTGGPSAEEQNQTGLDSGSFGKRSGGLFGGATSSSAFAGGTSGFGGTALSGGLFGTSSTRTSPPSRGLFGTTWTHSGGGLFGTVGTSNDSLQSGSASPSTGENQRAPQPTSNVFGKPQATAPSQSAGLFGSLNTQTPTSTRGLFGNNQPSSGAGLFGALAASSEAPPPEQPPASEPGTEPVPKATSNVSGVTQAAAPTQSTGSSGFGKSPATSGQPSGAAPSASSTPSGSLFGSKPQPAPATGLSSSPSSVPSPSLFGGAKPVTATQPGSLFGNNSQTAPVVGVSGSSTSPVVPSSLSEGAKPPTSETVPSKSLFGTPGQSAPSAPPPTFSSGATQRNPPLDPFSLFSVPRATPSPSPSAGTKAAEEKRCKSCDVSLAFHSALEQTARKCDRCLGHRDTQCWVCQGLSEKAEREGKGKEEEKGGEVGKEGGVEGSAGEEKGKAVDEKD